MQQHVNLAINKEMGEITDDKQGNRRGVDDSSVAIILGVFVKHMVFGGNLICSGTVNFFILFSES